MFAYNPWLTGIPVGFLAGWAAGTLIGPQVALIAGGITWVAFSKGLQHKQRSYEDRLLFQQRLYRIDVEHAFAQIQRAMANVWMDESHWHNRLTDMASGYMLYRYEWREPGTAFHDERIRHHANLQIDCEDRSDGFGVSTLITFSFDGLPNLVNKRVFYDTVELALDAIDYGLPDFTSIC
jgi:hypothetical protein